MYLTFDLTLHLHIKHSYLDLVLPFKCLHCSQIFILSTASWGSTINFLSLNKAKKLLNKNFEKSITGFIL